MSTTWIKNADWVIAWDEAAGRHVYQRDADVVFGGSAISFVGRGYSGKAEVMVDGKDRMVMPGLVDIHSHPEHEPAYRGIREEHGVPEMYMSGLFERSQSFSATDDMFRAASAEFAYCELLRSGVTSLVDITPAWEGWIQLLAKSGLRGFVAPGYASARWKLEGKAALGYVWDEEAAKKRFAAALKLIDEAAKDPSGRLSGIVSPMQIDTCSADLLRDSYEAATEKRVPFTVHIAQGVNEVLEIIRRHDKTPIQWAAEIGILGPGTILAHALFIDTHSWIRWCTRKDLAIMAEHACSVAHCPTPFARYGHIMENFGDYLRAGINMGIGTDTTPHNMIEEMRKAAVLARIAARDLKHGDHRRSPARRHHRRRQGTGPQRHRKAGAGQEGGHRGGRPDLPRDDSRARPAPLARLSRGRSRSARRVDRRTPGGPRGPGHDARPAGRRRTSHRGTATDDRRGAGPRLPATFSRRDLAVESSRCAARVRGRDLP
jgi:5-methylthioadenosine/S-adenosylhomocysteine deaminase